MLHFDESYILLPSATLEDFPTDASAGDARELLAGWTVLWHPRILAATKQIPGWFRADSPPEPELGRLVVAPSLSHSGLPEGFADRFRTLEGSQWLVGRTREAMLAELGLPDEQPLRGTHRDIAPQDFFAFGYVMLQVQVMTRRLRYTSNLDEIHVQKRVVAAAEAFVAGDAETAITSLHEAFDSLAEERDHYFSTDPWLLDLTLLAPSTLARYAGKGEPPNSTSADGVLGVPANVLLDAEMIEFLDSIREGGGAVVAPEAIDAGKQLLDDIQKAHVGWVAGGPSKEIVFDLLDFNDAEQQLVSAHERAVQIVGQRPIVYGRMSGSTPADLTRCLVQLDYRGMIPIDFAGGTGFGDEAKVIRRDGGAELEALTARPIDASSDSAFLTLATRLGEQIDSGEIATGLFVHWPGQACESFNDLRRAASWTLALGRFGTMENYFIEGEHPYHHGSGKTQSPEASEQLVSQVARGASDPLAAVAQACRRSILARRDTMASALLRIAGGNSGESVTDISEQLQKALGCRTEGSDSKIASHSLTLNPYAAATRELVIIEGPARRDDHVFAVSSESGSDVVSLDVPAMGFACAETNASGGSKAASGSAGFLKSLLRGQPHRIASGLVLQNEFIEASIDAKTGGIQGVFSGAMRGNRLSSRIVLGYEESTMQCERHTIVASTPSRGVIETTGSIVNSSQQRIASFRLEYTLQRGSRSLHVRGQIDVTGNLGVDPWKHYVAHRVAVATDTGSTRAFLRNKLHRTHGRRLVSPLGVLIDEAERQTLVASHGHAYHKRVQDRFLDTLLVVRGENRTSFELTVGFDVPQPLEAAMAAIAPALSFPIDPIAESLRRGWILHVAPKDVAVVKLEAKASSTGDLEVRLRLARTRSTGGKTTVRFCRSIVSAHCVDALDRDALDRDALDGEVLGHSDGASVIGVTEPDLAASENATDSEPENLVDVPAPDAAAAQDDRSVLDKRYGLVVDEDSVKLSMSGHEIVDLKVLLSTR